MKNKFMLVMIFVFSIALLYLPSNFAHAVTELKPLYENTHSDIFTSSSDYRDEFGALIDFHVDGEENTYFVTEKVVLKVNSEGELMFKTDYKSKITDAVITDDSIFLQVMDGKDIELQKLDADGNLFYELKRSKLMENIVGEYLTKIHFNDDKLYLSTLTTNEENINTHLIEVFDITGKRLKEINLGAGNRPSFNDPVEQNYSLFVPHNFIVHNDRIFSSGVALSTIKTFNTDGEVISSYSKSDISMFKPIIINDMLFCNCKDKVPIGHTATQNAKIFDLNGIPSTDLLLIDNEGVPIIDGTRATYNNDKLYVLTWNNGFNRILVYDVNSLPPLESNSFVASTDMNTIIQNVTVHDQEIDLEIKSYSKINSFEFNESGQQIIMTIGGGDDPNKPGITILPISKILPNQHYVVPSDYQPYVEYLVYNDLITGDTFIALKHMQYSNDQRTVPVMIFGINSLDNKNVYAFENTSLIQNSKVESTIIPSWIKNNAEFWVQDQIDDDTFVSGIQFLITEGIISVSSTSDSNSSSSDIPEWVKNNADWWSQGIISDTDFLKGIEFLVENGIIAI